MNPFSQLSSWSSSDTCGADPQDRQTLGLSRAAFPACHEPSFRRSRHAPSDARSSRWRLWASHRRSGRSVGSVEGWDEGERVLSEFVQRGPRRWSCRLVWLIRPSFLDIHMRTRFTAHKSFLRLYHSCYVVISADRFVEKHVFFRRSHFRISIFWASWPRSLT